MSGWDDVIRLCDFCHQPINGYKYYVRIIDGGAVLDALPTLQPCGHVAGFRPAETEEAP